MTFSYVYKNISSNGKQFLQIYIKGKHLGRGAGGEVFEVYTKIGHLSYALKIESTKIKSNPRLLFEHKIYKMLEPFHIFPKVYWYGEENRAQYLKMCFLGQESRKNYFLLKKVRKWQENLF